MKRFVSVLVLLFMVAIQTQSFHHCIENHGECEMDAEDHLSFPAMTQACLENHVTESDCLDLYMTNCGIAMGCHVPQVCETTPSPWCEKEEMIDFQ